MNSPLFCASGHRNLGADKSEVRVEYERVSMWLNTLEKLSSNDRFDFDLEQVRTDLDDACWLADWKREDVLLDQSKIPFAELEEILLGQGK